MPGSLEVAHRLGGVAVPPVGPQVCPVCHGYRRRGYELCTACHRVRAQLGALCALVVPVALVEPGGAPLYRLLCAYKDPRRSPSARAEASAALRAVLAGFIAEHAACIHAAASRRFQVVTTVPSSGRRLGRHPLAELVGDLRGASWHHAPLLERGTGALAHLCASPDGFVVPPGHGSLVGSRVLVVDDAYTTGARAQSAVAGLVGAGADVVGIVAIARLVTPGFREAAAWWQLSRQAAYDPSRCCLEAGRREEHDREGDDRERRYHGEHHQ